MFSREGDVEREAFVGIEPGVASTLDNFLRAK